MVNFKLNKSDYQLIWAFVLFMAIWLSLKFWTESNPIGQILFDIPIIIAKTLAGFFIVRWLIQRYLIEKRRYFLFCALTTLALIATGFLDLLRDYFGSGGGWQDLPSWDYVLVHSFYYSAADLGVPFVIIVGKKYYENQVSLSQIKQRQKETELKLLQSQLSPHFLFNNLNTLDALIDSDPDKAKSYLAHLSSLYRYLTRSKEDELSLLSDELEMANDYFYLIENRFGQAYSFQIEFKDTSETNKAYLPTGTLQTLIENVVKHNGVVNGKAIQTQLVIDKGQLTVSNTKGCSNNDSGESFGTGLQNLKERYGLLADRGITIIDSDTVFKVDVPLLSLP